MALQITRSLRSPNSPPRQLWLPCGAIAIPDAYSARIIAERLNLPAAELRALSLIDEAMRVVMDAYCRQTGLSLIDAADRAAPSLREKEEMRLVLTALVEEFPAPAVFDGLAEPGDWLEAEAATNRETALEQLLLIRLFNENPACAPYRRLFDDGMREEAALPGTLAARTPYHEVFNRLEAVLKGLPAIKTPEGSSIDLVTFLREPARRAPRSLKDQLAWIAEHWGALLGDFRLTLLSGIDMINEEQAPRFPPGPGPAQAYSYRSLRHEYEKFSPDRSWMPSLVLLAKNALVWLHQLSRTYGRPITRLDEIPEEELVTIAERGINGLWLIGIWERSPASEKIKKLCGNPDAAASAYSLFDYEISPELGGWEALDRFREQCRQYGIRLAADMVPNHTGIDSRWVRERPDLFISLPHCPFPSYTFNGPDLSSDPTIGIWLEDHYYSRTDAAVVFKRLDRRTGDIRYIYHGNDGTSMPWNDTAQIDFLNPAARQAVMERILHVAQHFSIIRFDAAMVLAKQHIRRLWYPAPGAGGAIPSRSEHAMSDEAFDRAMPNEFWREVVDLCAQKAPDTLLLAEAFWLMEGYFVRTLGMHRVYNSAFMNMLKEEKNSLYRLTIKNTMEFDRDILKRFVNFLSNPDEETAVGQFGKGDKYFGVCTLLATMPGLPMIAHGQIEGFTEKYGMEFKRSYRDETPDRDFIARHEREIFPLLRMRPLFAEVEHFYLFDFVRSDGAVDENVFAYSNGLGQQRALVFYNNHWERTSGKIHTSCAFTVKLPDNRKHLETVSLARALGIDPSPGNFVIMHEIRSGLWHIYRSEDIAAAGLSVSLEGYQNKVYLDICNVHDTEGRYARLYEIFGSRGIADLDDALLEADQPDLYRALYNALSSLDGIESAQELSRQEAIERAAIFAEMFFARLCTTAGSEFPHPAPRAAAIGRAISWLEMVLSFLYPSETKPAGLSVPENRLIHLVYAFVEGLLRALSEDGLRSEIRHVVEEYRIARKLREFASRRGRAASFRYAGDLDAAACAEIAIAWALHCVQEREKGNSLFMLNEEVPPAGSEGEAAVHIASGFFKDPLLREALWVNRYRGTEYFNRERIAFLLDMLPDFARIASIDQNHPAGRPELASFWGRVASLIGNETEEAGYRTEDLILRLKGSV